jgi:D-beta-D-heptose 7-phosphate kinase/D-beta-D-heptose 1-phosphate adenosyltransferase
MLLLDVERLKSIVEAFGRQEVLILGDCMLDEYLWGSVGRISPEAPVPVVDVKEESVTLGGAANVASNVLTLGGKPRLVGVIGDDKQGGGFFDRMEERGLDLDGIIQAKDRPTTVKTRIVAHSQHVVRADREARSALEESDAEWVRNKTFEILESCDAVIVSDYGKGVVSPGLLKELIERAREAGKRVSVDPKMTHFRYYSGASVITPNKHEASQAARRPIEDETSLQEAGWSIMSDLRLDALLITRGEEGMSLFETGRNYVHLPTKAREVFDVTGAGDTVISTLTLAVAAGASMVEGAEIANHAARIAVGQVGTTSVTQQELLKSFGT